MDSISFFFFFIYLFIWLCWVLVVTGGLLSCGSLFSCGMRTLSCSMHVGSSPLTRDRTRALCIGSTESYPLCHQRSPLDSISWKEVAKSYRTRACGIREVVSCLFWKHILPQDQDTCEVNVAWSPPVCSLSDKENLLGHYVIMTKSEYSAAGLPGLKS